MKTIADLFGKLFGGKKTRAEKIKGALENDPVLQDLDKRIGELNDREGERLKNDELAMRVLREAGIYLSDDDEKAAQKATELEQKEVKQSVIDDIVINVDKEVIIGEQVWMSKNLNVAMFRNGEPIPHAKSKAEWKEAEDNKKPAWCYYNNNPQNGEVFGKLYNWYAVNDARGLAPEGWRVPSVEDWKALIDYSGGEYFAGSELKNASGWYGGGGTNKSGFSALPGGSRTDYNFDGLTFWGYWWSSTQAEKFSDAFLLLLSVDDDDAKIQLLDKETGFSVRCIKE